MRWFRGGTFDNQYNNRTPIDFTVPSGAKYIQLEAVITGHGFVILSVPTKAIHDTTNSSDENGCGEFCVTQHVFTFNQQFNASVTFSEAGNQFGCADNVPYGVEPNEHGTWYYGRDGWCDGQDVRPWVR